MISIRFAIWAAVSTKAQARPDKISLADQEARCRAVATAKGWEESAGPYIVKGESRTLYVDLQTAEQAIPELRAMLEAAKRREFDVLVIYDNNRFRDLLMIVARVLISYRIQPYSISQPVDPQPPETFNPNRADTLWMMLGMSDIISHNQISDLRRKYEVGMPSRVRDKGLPANSIPFGYRKPPGRESDRQAIPEQDPITAPVVVAFKNLLLAGRSLSQIIKFAEGTGIKPPRGKQWYAASIREILRNPFYAGYNRWGMSKTFTDLRTGKRIRNRDVPLAEIIVERGQHQALWDDETHQLIIAELDRRGNSYQGKVINQLSKVLKCQDCNTAMWMQYNGSRNEPKRAIWRCSNKTCRKGAIHNSLALEQLSQKLHDVLLTETDPRQIETNQATTRMEQAKLDELVKRRDRITDLFETGGLPKNEYMSRRAALDNQIFAAERELNDAVTAIAERAQRQQLLADFRFLINEIPDWIITSDPQEINRALVLLLDHVTVKEDQIAQIIFRD